MMCAISTPRCWLGALQAGVQVAQRRLFARPGPKPQAARRRPVQVLDDSPWFSGSRSGWPMGADKPSGSAAPPSGRDSDTPRSASGPQRQARARQQAPTATRGPHPRHRRTSARQDIAGTGQDSTTQKRCESGINALGISGVAGFSSSM